MVIIIEPNIKTTYLYLFSKEIKLGQISIDNMEEIENKKSIKNMLDAVKAGEKVSKIIYKLAFGGEFFKGYIKVDEKFFGRFQKSVQAYPFYIPYADKIMRLFYKHFKNIPMYAFFDTAYFNNLPQEEKNYAVASAYIEDGVMQKHGFHGIYHEFNGKINPHSKTISVVIDNKTTLCAIDNLKPLTISLGYTPLEGIMSRKSSGDIDPGIVFYLMRQHGYSIFEIDNILKNKSGFFGITEYDLPMDEMFTLYGKDKKVTFAFNVYANHILKYFGEGMSVLGGVDTIVFSGKDIKKIMPFIHNFLKKISFLGINLKCLPWENSKITEISTEKSKVKVFINNLESPEIILNMVNEIS